MKTPVQITYRNMPSSEALEALIRERADKLETYCDGIVGCRVLVDLPHRHHRDGNVFHVRIDLAVPGDDIVVTYEPGSRSILQETGSDEARKAASTAAPSADAYAAVRDAFDIARRRLQDFARRQRGAVKTHEPAAGRQPLKDSTWP